MSEINGTIWKHRKTGGIYVVEFDAARIESTLERSVVYRNMETGDVWVRPAGEFFDGRFEHVKG